jgi:hypothetical protein
MSTILQKRLAKKVVENAKSKKPLNRKQMLISVGYEPSTASVRAKDILESDGVQEELALLGFTEEGAKAVVKKLMYDNRVAPADRLKASDQVFKVTGAYAPEKSINMNLNFTVSDEEKKRIDEILNDNAE